jgi:hypothetical protein
MGAALRRWGLIGGDDDDKEEENDNDFEWIRDGNDSYGDENDDQDGDDDDIEVVMTPGALEMVGAVLGLNAPQQRAYDVGGGGGSYSDTTSYSNDDAELAAALTALSSSDAGAGLRPSSVVMVAVEPDTAPLGTRYPNSDARLYGDRAGAAAAAGADRWEDSAGVDAEAVAAAQRDALVAAACECARATAARLGLPRIEPDLRVAAARELAPLIGAEAAARIAPGAGAGHNPVAEFFSALCALDDGAGSSASAPTPDRTQGQRQRASQTPRTPQADADSAALAAAARDEAAATAELLGLPSLEPVLLAALARAVAAEHGPDAGATVAPAEEQPEVLVRFFAPLAPLEAAAARARGESATQRQHQPPEPQAGDAGARTAAAAQDFARAAADRVGHPPLAPVLLRGLAHDITRTVGPAAGARLHAATSAVPDHVAAFFAPLCALHQPSVREAVAKTGPGTADESGAETRRASAGPAVPPQRQAKATPAATKMAPQHARGPAQSNVEKQQQQQKQMKTARMQQADGEDDISENEGETSPPPHLSSSEYGRALETFLQRMPAADTRPAMGPRADARARAATAAERLPFDPYFNPAGVRTEAAATLPAGRGGRQMSADELCARIAAEGGGETEAQVQVQSQSQAKQAAQLQPEARARVRASTTKSSGHTPRQHEQARPASASKQPTIPPQHLNQNQQPQQQAKQQQQPAETAMLRRFSSSSSLSPMSFTDVDVSPSPVDTPHAAVAGAGAVRPRAGPAGVRDRERGRATACTAGDVQQPQQRQHRYAAQEEEEEHMLAGTSSQAAADRGSESGNDGEWHEPSQRHAGGSARRHAAVPAAGSADTGAEAGGRRSSGDNHYEILAELASSASEDEKDEDTDEGVGLQRDQRTHRVQTEPAVKAPAAAPATAAGKKGNKSREPAASVADEADEDGGW